MLGFGGKALNDKLKSVKLKTELILREIVKIIPAKKQLFGGRIFSYSC